MNDSKRLFSAAALAAASFPAIASASLAPASANRAALAPIVFPTGLTAADLIVGRDGTLSIDVVAPTKRVADESADANRQCGQNTNNGC